MSAETSTNLFSILESDDYGEGCVWPDVIKQVNEEKPVLGITLIRHQEKMQSHQRAAQK